MNQKDSLSTQITSPRTENSEKTYIQFPLCTLALFHENPVETLKNIVAYGITYRNKNLRYSDHDVIRQLIYDNYRGHLYPESLRDELDSMDYNSEDASDGNWLFDPKDGSFNPDDDRLIGVNEMYYSNSEFKEKAISNYKITMAIGNCDLDLSDIYTKDRFDVIRNYQKQQEKLFRKQPMPSVNTDIIFWFIENPENIHLFAACTAIRSLIGRHDYTATNKDVVVMRMIGAKSNDALKHALNSDHLKEIYDLYTNPYQFHKLTEALRDKNFIQSCFGDRRKYFFSTKLDYDQLGDRANQYFAERDYKGLERRARANLEQRN